MLLIILLKHIVLNSVMSRVDKRMNRLLIIIVLFLIRFINYSQDTIVMKHNKIQVGRVVEVDVNKIKFKKSELPNGPIYEISKRDVIKIHYSNGYTDFVGIGIEPKMNNKNLSPSNILDTRERVFFNIFFQPNLAYRIRTYQSDISPNIFNYDYPRFGYSTGLLVGFRFNRILELTTGLTYSQEGYRTNIPLDEYVFTDYYPMSITGTSFVPPKKLIYITRLSYFNIPIAVSIKSSIKKIQLGCSLGIIGKIFLGGDVKTVFISDTNRRVATDNINGFRDIKPVNLSVFIGFDYENMITNRTAIFIQPNFECMVFSMEKYDYMWTNLINIGLRFGLLIYL